MNRSRKFELPGIQDLSKEQEAARALPAEGRHLVVGGPGTGKSVLALLRARRHYQDGVPYLFLVFNHLLHQATKQLFGDGLESRTWMSWFHEVFWQVAEEPVPKISSGGDRFRPIDWNGVEKIIADLPEIPAIDRPFLVIDEGQDMPPQFYHSLVNLGFENFFVVADQNQQITEENSSIADIRKVLDVRLEEVVRLRRNYRNPRSVAELAAHFCTDDRSSTQPELPARTNADAPLLYEYQGNHLDRVASGIVMRAFRNPQELIGVMTPNNAVRERYFEALGRAVIRRRKVHAHVPTPRIATFHGEHRTDVAFDEGGILVINAQACKGLEFDISILADIDEHLSVADPDRMLRLFYVMVARSKERVYMVMNRSSSRSPRLLEEILPDDRAMLVRKSV